MYVEVMNLGKACFGDMLNRNCTSSEAELRLEVLALEWLAFLLEIAYTIIIPKYYLIFKIVIKKYFIFMVSTW